MKITFDKKAGDKLVNILCEIDALIADGTISIGMTGISPDAAKFIHIFYQMTTGPGIEVIITDRGLFKGLKLHLTKNK